jgi:FAD/FMN-containing dehydrogenase
VIPRLAGRLHGELLLPHDHGYDDARRGFNRLHDRRPAVIVRPADADDIARALEAAAGAGLEVAIRSGGHSLAGYGTTEGGLLLDLSGAIRHLAKGAYVNFLEVKRRYDPTQPLPPQPQSPTGSQ